MANQWLTIEDGLVRFDDGRFVAQSGRPVISVQRSIDGTWHSHYDMHGGHCIGAPAGYTTVFSCDFYEYWKRFGNFTRVDGPSILGGWFLDGIAHRIEGPAIESELDWMIDGIAISPLGWQRRGRRLRWLRHNFLA